MAQDDDHQMEQWIANCLHLTDAFLPFEVSLFTRPAPQNTKAYAVAFFPAKRPREHRPLLSLAFLVVAPDGSASCATSPARVCTTLQTAHPAYNAARTTCNGWHDLRMGAGANGRRLNTWLKNDLRARALDAESPAIAEDLLVNGAPQRTVFEVAEDAGSARRIAASVAEYMHTSEHFDRSGSDLNLCGTVPVARAQRQAQRQAHPRAAERTPPGRRAPDGARSLQQRLTRMHDADPAAFAEAVVPIVSDPRNAALRTLLIQALFEQVFAHEAEVDPVPAQAVLNPGEQALIPAEYLFYPPEPGQQEGPPEPEQREEPPVPPAWNAGQYGSGSNKRDGDGGSGSLARIGALISRVDPRAIDAGAYSDRALLRELRECLPDSLPRRDRGRFSGDGGHSWSALRDAVAQIPRLDASDESIALHEQEAIVCLQSTVARAYARERSWLQRVCERVRTLDLRRVADRRVVSLLEESRACFASHGWDAAATTTGAAARPTESPSIAAEETLETLTALLQSVAVWDPALWRLVNCLRESFQ